MAEKGVRLLGLYPLDRVAPCVFLRTPCAHSDQGQASEMHAAASSAQVEDILLLLTILRSSARCSSANSNASTGAHGSQTSPGRVCPNTPRVNGIHSNVDKAQECLRASQERKMTW